VGIVGAGFLITTLADGFTQSKDAREKAAADSLFRARTEEITRQQQEGLAEILSIRSESDSLRLLQRQALARMDSIAATGEQLSDLQRQTVRDLTSELALSRQMSDSLHASVALSRGIADSLLRADARAHERTRETLAMVRRAQNPVESLRASVMMFLRPETPHSKALLTQLLTDRYTTGDSLRLRWGIHAVVDERPVHFGFPEAIVLSIWPAASECPVNGGGVPLVWAKRELNYDSIKTNLSTFGLQLDFPEGEFQFATTQEVSVEDLRDACVRLSFYGYAGWEGAAFWQHLSMALPRVALPQGRRGRVHFDLVSGAYSHGTWIGRLELDSEL
jgi:hypothetical protein